MKQVTRTFDLYELDELTKESRDRAISDHIQFEIEVMDSDSPYYECVDEMDRMGTPWFLAEYINDNYRDRIVESIKANNYLFFADGNIIPVDLYPEDHDHIQ